MTRSFGSNLQYEPPLSQCPEPIAIVGMGCRLPGKVVSPSSLWDLLINKRSAQSEKVPESRFNIDSHIHENLERPGSFTALGGYFLDDDLKAFDASFFGISPIEAMWMDPQQRKLLEVVYECFESSGLTLDDVNGSKTSVFVGSFTSDFQQMSFKEPDFRHNYSATGVDPGIISNRISHVFNLVGPSFTINTACSSSVYAFHQAINALHQRDCEAALVSGTNLILTVDQHMNTAKLGVLSPTSTCHTFDASANGYGRAEGVGAMYLKRLSDALRDGDPIRAVIRGSAVNSNGKAPNVGITHPNMNGQEYVIREAYRRAGDLNPSLTGYFECHGTGTAIGDPLEVEALARAMTGNRDTFTYGPLLIGAIKTNIGHSEAASGMAAVMKAVLAVESGLIPPTYGLQNPNPKIRFDEWGVKVVTETTPWPASLPVRRVSVNSFGYGGTNAHIIVEGIDSIVPGYKAPIRRQLTAEKKGLVRSGLEREQFLLAFSAHDRLTLKKNISSIQNVAEEYDLLDLSYTLGVRRSHLSSRAFSVATSGTVTVALEEDSLKFADKTNSVVAKAAFVFTGQGAQWPRMGVELMTTFPSFLKSIRGLDDVLKKLPNGPDWTIEDALSQSKETSRINDVDQSQPLCTAVQVAIVNLLASWNITPAAVVGHSSGEIAAAYAAGYLTAEEAIVIAYYRGKVVSENTRKGAMLAVGMGAAEVAPLISEYKGRIVAACENSPQSTTLSGDADAIEELTTKLQDAKIFARALSVGGRAYHSHHMKDHANKYENYVQDACRLLGLDKKSKTIDLKARMMSSVVTDILGPEALTHSYWSQNLTNPVRFDGALRKLLTKDSSINQLIEIGPHTALAGPIRQIQIANGIEGVTYHSTLVRFKDATEQLLRLAGGLYLQGYPVDLERVNSIEQPRDKALSKISVIQGQLIVDLPTYQWNSSKVLWAEPRASAEHRAKMAPRHDVLGRKVVGGLKDEPTWKNFLRQKDLPWLAHHQLGAEVVFPGAGYWAMAIEAVTQMHQESDKESQVTGFIMRDIDIMVALVVPDDEDGIEVLFSMHKLPSVGGNDWYGFRVSSVWDGEWKTHTTGTISALCSRQEVEIKKLPNFTQRSSGKAWYQAFSEVGFHYGPSFQGLEGIQTNPKVHAAAATSKIQYTSGLVAGESHYVIHPSTIDHCLQLMLVAIYSGKIKTMEAGFVPLKADQIVINIPHLSAGQKPSTGQAFSWIDKRGHRSVLAGAQLVANDQLLLDISRVRCVSYEAVVPPKIEGQEIKRYWQGSWRPDFSSLRSHDAEFLLARVPESDQFQFLLELLFFKDPNTNLLEISTSPEGDGEFWNHGQRPISLGRYDVAFTEDTGLTEATAQFGTNSQFGFISTNLDLEGLESDSYHYALLDLQTDDLPVSFLESVRTTLKPGGSLILRTTEGSESLISSLRASMFSIRLRAGNFIFADKEKPPTITVGNRGMLYLVNRSMPSQLSTKLEHMAYSAQWQVKQVPLENCLIPPNSHVIMLAEYEEALLANIEESEFEKVKHILANASSIVWVTNGGLLKGRRPKFAMARGLARSIISEQASLKFATLDIDLNREKLDRVCEVTLSVVEGQVYGPSSEDELILSRGRVCINRVLPRKTLNQELSGEMVVPGLESLEQGQTYTGQINRSLKNIIVFHRASSTEKVPADKIRVEVKALGVAHEDTLLVNGTTFTTMFSQEFAGIVVAVGSEVRSVIVGDSVFGVSPDKELSTHLLISPTACQKFEPNSDTDYTKAATIPVAYSTAVHTLVDLARISDDDRLLVLHETGSAGVAVVKFAQHLGVEVFVTATSIEHKKAITEILDILPSHILLTGADLKEFDVVVGADESAASTEAWAKIAPTGKFIYLGVKKNQIESILTQPFARGASYSSFDLLEWRARRPRQAKELLGRVAEFYRKGTIQALPPVVFDIDAADAAFARYSESLSEGKRVVNIGSQGSLVKVQLRKPRQLFRSDSSYLLVGCLGGLGRSLTTWMIDNGARDLIFLSRSGTDNPAAATLVDDIRAQGVEVTVTRGDASSKADVERVKAGIDPKRPIRGIVQAAMVLVDGFFDRMTINNFKTSINPKVNGTQNLHDVFLDQELEFFVMTSSISGLLGTPGQSNYSAANNYLDSLARHRQSLGLPCVSLILPMVLGVGYVSDHPEIEEGLTRKGLYGIDEEELLEGFDKAISSQVFRSSGVYSRLEQIVIGLEPSRLAKAIGNKQTTDAFWLAYDRLSHVRSNLEALQSQGNGGKGGSCDILNSIRDAPSPEAAAQLATAHVIEKLSRMLLVAAEEFEPRKTVSNYGLDSMLGAEFRNSLFKDFGVDVSYQQLMGPTMTLSALGEHLCML